MTELTEPTGAKATAVTGRVTKDDLQAKLEDIRSTVDGTVEEAKVASSKAVMIGGGLLLLLVVYLLGRRAGKRRRTFVEIRRI